MLKALNDKNYNAAGTLAVQCAISAGDAVCVHEKEIRSVSENHLDLCGMVKTVPRVQAIKKSNTLKRIVGKKNLIQYESRSIRRVEAETLIKSTIRFFRWVADVVK
jgi:hypothetical protein